MCLVPVVARGCGVDACGAGECRQGIPRDLSGVRGEAVGAVETGGVTESYGIRSRN